MLLEVQCEVSTDSDDLGCHVICWCWSTVLSEVHSQRSHYTGAVPHAVRLHASCTDAVIHAKGGKAKYLAHRNEHTFQKPDICLKYPFFIDLM